MVKIVAVPYLMLTTGQCCHLSCSYLSTCYSYFTFPPTILFFLPFSSALATVKGHNTVTHRYSPAHNVTPLERCWKLPVARWSLSDVLSRERLVIAFSTPSVCCLRLRSDWMHIRRLQVARIHTVSRQ